MERQRRGSNYHINGRPIQTQHFPLTKGRRLAFVQHLLQALVDGFPAHGVKEFPHWLADELFGRVCAEQFDPGRVNEDDALVALDEKGVRRKLDKASIFLLAGLQRLFGLSALDPKIGLAQRAMDRWRQRRQVMFQHEVGCAGLESVDGHLFAEGTGHEDERHIRNFVLSNRKSGKAIERRQAVVRKNYRRMKSMN